MAPGRVGAGQVTTPGPEKRFLREILGTVTVPRQPQREAVQAGHEFLETEFHRTSRPSPREAS